ncbi:MAG: alpha/beta fold hydrolase [Actinobacteria bacterium]|nr:alpha/beta fold hydrolase [Actinomycetota bacterium]
MSVPPFLALPRGVQPARLSVNGVAMAALEIGSPESDQRALLVPGFTGSKEDFIALLPLLGDAGVHAVAVDLVGQYESRTNAAEERFTLAALAADLVATSGARWPVGRRPHLVGHSLGGLIAREAVLTAPGAFESLVLMSSGPGAVPAHQRPALEALEALLPQTDLEVLWEAKQSLDAAKDLPLPPPEIQAFLRERWLCNNPVGLRAKAGILLRAPDRTDELAALSTRSMVVHGSDDDVWSPDLQRQMAERLNASHHPIEAVGHSPAAEAAEETAAALLEFWRDEG